LTNATGETVLAIYEPDNAGEHMVLTMSGYYPVNPPANLYTRLLPYGIINWATRGVFLGERKLYFVGQPDDVLAWGDRWDATTHLPIYDNGYRNDPGDLQAVADWMAAFGASEPNAADFKVEIPFNGQATQNDRVGGEPEGAILTGTLTAKVVDLADEFVWLNHTFTHADMDPVNRPTADFEIGSNVTEGQALGFTDLVSSTLLTGAYSGLGNPHVTAAAYDLGVRYMLVNESVAGYKNPSPNTGIPHPGNADILMIPRYANNIFYFATTPDEEVDYYNWVYCPGYDDDPVAANRCFDYETVIDLITNQAFGFMLDFSINPTMFHMNNLEDYGGGRSLMRDFVESLYTKYNTYYRADVPVQSLRTQEIGERMLARASYNTAGVQGVVGCDGWLTVTTVSATTIPITGLDLGGATEAYAGQTISRLDLPAGGGVTAIGGAPRAPAPVAVLTQVQQGSDTLLSWTPTTQGTDGDPMGALVYRVYRGDAPGFEKGPATLLVEVTEPGFADLGAGPQGYSYAVSAVGDDCWKRESVPTEPSPTAVRLVSLRASSALPVVAVPMAAAMVLLFSAQPRKRPEAV